MLFFVFDIIGYIVNFVMAYIIYKTVGSILTLRRSHWLLSLIVVISFFYVGNIPVFPEEVTGTFGTFILFIMTAILLYKDRLIIKVSTVFIIYPIAVSLSYLTEDFGFVTWYYIFDKGLSLEGQAVTHVLFNILRALMWYFIYHYTKYWITRISKELTARMWLVIDTVSITSCIGIVTIIQKTTIMTSYAAYPACISCIITSLGSCYLCSYISKTLKAEMEIQTLKYQQTYYQELDENHKTVRKLRHDMKNHLNIIGTFLRDDHFEEAKDYLSDLSEEFTAGTYNFCDNSIVNAVLNAKYNLAIGKHIDCSIHIDIHEAVPLDDINLCSLLSNTLDNAIESCQKISLDKPRWIQLKARSHNGHFSYEISNSKANAIRYRHKEIITDKENRAAHGIGLKTITEIINKHHGHLEISHTDEIFSLTALI